MKSFVGITLSVALITAVVGCANLPDAKVTYYLAKTKVSFKVTRTIACDANNNLVVISSTTPTVSHSADPSKPKELELSQLKGRFVDTNVKVSFYPDGRLKDVNATMTGQGEAILKTAVSILTPAFALDAGPTTFPAQCAFIKKQVGDKPMTLTYEGFIDVDSAAVVDSDGNVVRLAQPIQPDPTSGVYIYAGNLDAALGDVCAFVGTSVAPKQPVFINTASKGTLVHAQQPALLNVEVRAGANCSANPLWNGAVPVAQLGSPYDLPVPKPATFGTETFAATFEESGAISSVQYVKNTGAGQALNVVGALQTSLKDETTAQKALDVKAEADLIAQQQRLVQCLADPKNCK